MRWTFSTTQTHCEHFETYIRIAIGLLVRMRNKLHENVLGSVHDLREVDLVQLENSLLGTDLHHQQTDHRDQQQQCYDRSSSSASSS